MRGALKILDSLNDFMGNTQTNLTQNCESITNCRFDGPANVLIFGTTRC